MFKKIVLSPGTSIRMRNMQDRYSGKIGALIQESRKHLILTQEEHQWECLKSFLRDDFCRQTEKPGYNIKFEVASYSLSVCDCLQ
jgi:hypothetical protein